MSYINPYRLFTGSLVPNWLLERREISQGAKLAYARLSQHAGKNGFAWPKRETLARELGVTTRQVDRYLKELEVHQLLEVEQLGLTKANRYRFPVHIWMSTLEKTHMSTQDSTDMSAQDSSDMSTHIGRESIEENHKKELPQDQDNETGAKAPDSSSIKRSRKHGRAAPAEPEAFTRWYEAFPRHEARADALKAWLKLNPDPILVDTIMAATVRYTMAKAETEKKFIKTPPAWLNGKRWEDEVFSPGNGNSQNKPTIISTDEASDSFGLSDGTRINRGTYRRMYG